MGLGSLLIEETACGTDAGLPTEETGGDAVIDESSINGDTINCHTPFKGYLPDSAEASSSKRQRLEATPIRSVLSGNDTPRLTSPLLREHVKHTGTGRLVRLDSVCEATIDKKSLPYATVVSTLSPEQMEQIRAQQAGPISNASEMASNDGRMLDSHFHGSADTSPAKMSPEDPRKRTFEILALPIAKVIHPDGQQPEIVSDGQFRRRRLPFTLE